MQAISTGEHNRRGFTLVELVVVVLILGILAAVAAPKMFDTTGDARDNATRHSLGVIRDAIELHKAQNGAYPGEAGTEADFKADLEPFLKGPFPKSHVGLADTTVRVETSGTALSAAGTASWAYDNTTGEFIIDTAGYDTL